MRLSSPQGGHQVVQLFLKVLKIIISSSNTKEWVIVLKTVSKAQVYVRQLVILKIAIYSGGWNYGKKGVK